MNEVNVLMRSEIITRYFEWLYMIKKQSFEYLLPQFKSSCSRSLDLILRSILLLEVDKTS